MPIPLAEIRVTGLLGGDRHELPPRLGPTLRGVLGLTLRDLDRSGYDLLFEGRRSGRDLPFEPPQPMLLRLPAQWQPREQTSTTTAGTLSFGIRLLGPAVTHWRLVARALAEAGRRGLGKPRLPWALTHVVDAFTDQPLAENDPVDALSVHHPAVPASELIGQTLRWRFITPIRVREEGRIRAAPDGLTLLLATRRRLDLLRRAWGTATTNPPPWHECRRFDAHEFRTLQSDTQTVQLPRFSLRTKRSNTFYATAGSVTIQGPWTEVPWLLLANVYHLGKSTSFGFGRVQVTSANTSASATRPAKHPESTAIVHGDP